MGSECSVGVESQYSKRGKFCGKRVVLDEELSRVPCNGKTINCMCLFYPGEHLGR